MSKLFSHRVLGAVPPTFLATSLLTWLVVKLLRFVAEAKKLSNHHRTPIFFSIMGPWLQDLTSLKRPSAHKSFTRYLMPVIDGIFRTSEKIKPGGLFCVGPIMVSVIGADLRKSKKVGYLFPNPKYYE